MPDFRGSKLWDVKANPANRQCFSDHARDDAIRDTRTRALTVLRSVTEGATISEAELDGPLWALQQINPSEQLQSACNWFLAAWAYDRGDELRLVLCREAYGKIERALRCYL